SSYLFFFSSRRRHTRSKRDWSSDVCSSDLKAALIDTAFESVHVYIKNELKIMVERRRSNAILQMIEEFTKLYNDKFDLAYAEVRSEERRVGKECRYRWWPDN